MYGERPEILQQVPATMVGGLSIAALDIPETAAVMLRAIAEHKRGQAPLYFTSANGEALARCHTNPSVRELFARADMISADGQPLVLASRLRCARPLPERVATTDLFDPIAEAASKAGMSFFFYGGTEEENRKTVHNVKRRHPGLKVVGRTHGYLQDEKLVDAIKEINRLAPDLLWVALGVPREHEFATKWASMLGNVGAIKTCGGLYGFLSGGKARAPLWMQKAGLEWLFRLWLEPRRLFKRYLVTNPRAMWVLAVKSH